MLSTLVLLLPAAVGFALSPVPLVEMILVLLSKRSKSNGVLFLICIAVPVFFVAMLSATGLTSATQDDKEPSDVRHWILLCFSVLLIAMAFRNFANRRDQSVPKVFAAIDNMGPAGVVALSAGATVLNPKNLVILLGAGAVVAESALPPGPVMAVLAVFTVLATVPFSAAVAYVLLGGDVAAGQMQRAKEWLLAHNRMIMAVVLGVMGAVMGSKALLALFG